MAGERFVDDAVAGGKVMDAIRDGNDAALAALLVDAPASGCWVSLSKTTPLFTAILEGRLEATRLLLKLSGIDVNATGPQCATPLMAAAHYGRSEILDLLIAQGADIHAQLDGRRYQGHHLHSNALAIALSRAKTVRGARFCAIKLIQKGAVLPIPSDDAPDDVVQDYAALIKALRRKMKRAREFVVAAAAENRVKEDLTAWFAAALE